MTSKTSDEKEKQKTSDESDEITRSFFQTIFPVFFNFKNSQKVKKINVVNFAV